MMMKRHMQNDEAEDEHEEEDKWDLASVISMNSFKKIEKEPADQEDKALFEEETIKRNVVDETLPPAFKFLYVLFASSFVFVIVVALGLLSWADFEHRHFEEHIAYLRQASDLERLQETLHCNIRL